MSDLEKRDRSTMREGIMELKNKRRCQYFIGSGKDKVTEMQEERDKDSDKRWKKRGERDKLDTKY